MAKYPTATLNLGMTTDEAFNAVKPFAAERERLELAKLQKAISTGGGTGTYTERIQKQFAEDVKGGMPFADALIFYSSIPTEKIYAAYGKLEEYKGLGKASEEPLITGEEPTTTAEPAETGGQNWWDQVLISIFGE